METQYEPVSLEQALQTVAIPYSPGILLSEERLQSFERVVETLVQELAVACDSLSITTRSAEELEQRLGEKTWVTIRLSVKQRFICLFVLKNELERFANTYLPIEKLPIDGPPAEFELTYYAFVITNTLKNLRTNNVQLSTVERTTNQLPGELIRESLDGKTRYAAPSIQIDLIGSETFSKILCVIEPALICNSGGRATVKESILSTLSAKAELELEVHVPDLYSLMRLEVGMHIPLGSAGALQIGNDGPRIPISVENNETLLIRKRSKSNGV